MSAGEGSHFCKWCNTTFSIRVPLGYTGDAFVKCPECGYNHPRQFEAGVAISCNPPTTRPIQIATPRSRDD